MTIALKLDLVDDTAAMVCISRPMYFNALMQASFIIVMIYIK